MSLKVLCGEREREEEAVGERGAVREGGRDERGKSEGGREAVRQ